MRDSRVEPPQVQYTVAKTSSVHRHLDSQRIRRGVAPDTLNAGSAVKLFEPVLGFRAFALPLSSARNGTHPRQNNGDWEHGGGKY
jgi:hypothetical protein